MVFCRIGDKVWTEIEDSTFMEDVIYHNGQFYTLSQGIGLYLLRIEDGVNLCWDALTENRYISLLLLALANESNNSKKKKNEKTLTEERPGVFYLVSDIFTDTVSVN